MVYLSLLTGFLSIYGVLIMKHVFRWHVIISISMPHFFHCGKTWLDFPCTQRSWIVKHILIDVILCCMIAIIYHLPNQLFKTPWSNKELFLSLLCLFVIFQNLSDIATDKKRFVFRWFTLFHQKLRTRITLEMIQNNFKSSWMDM